MSWGKRVGRTSIDTLKYVKEWQMGSSGTGRRKSKLNALRDLLATNIYPFGRHDTASERHCEDGCDAEVFADAVTEV